MIANLFFVTNKILSTATIYIVIILYLMAANQLTSQTKEPEFYVDHAQFMVENNLILLEIIYSISRENLMYEKHFDGYQAKGEIKTYLMTPVLDEEDLTNEGPDLVNPWPWIKKHKFVTLIDSVIINDVVDSLDNILTVDEIIDLSMVKVKQGDYELLSIFTDLNSTKKKAIRDYYYIRNYPKKKVALSSIVLANAITEADGNVLRFDRNDLRVIPNVRRGYDSGTPKIKFYIEIYNLSINKEAKDSTYNVEYFVFDQKGQTVLKSQDEPRKKQDVNACIQGAINISDLPCAFYKFKIKITDNFTGKEAESEKNFYIHN